MPESNFAEVAWKRILMVVFQIEEEEIHLKKTVLFLFWHLDSKAAVPMRRAAFPVVLAGVQVDQPTILPPVASPNLILCILISVQNLAVLPVASPNLPENLDICQTDKTKIHLVFDLTIYIDWRPTLFLTRQARTASLPSGTVVFFGGSSHSWSGVPTTSKITDQ